MGFFMFSAWLIGMGLIGSLCLSVVVLTVFEAVRETMRK